MNNLNWNNSVNQYTQALQNMQVTVNTNPLSIDEGFEKLYHLTCSLRKNHGTIYLIGNGASASMASHLSADLAKNAKMHTQVFSDLSLITAMANDLSYDDVFAEPLKSRGSQNDILVGISSSGESLNILKAAEVARQLNMDIITYTAFSKDNSLRKIGDINFYVEVNTYGAAESCHSMILHHWMDMVSL